MSLFACKYRVSAEVEMAFRELLRTNIVQYAEECDLDVTESDLDEEVETILMRMCSPAVFDEHEPLIQKILARMDEDHEDRMQYLVGVTTTLGERSVTSFGNEYDHGYMWAFGRVCQCGCNLLPDGRSPNEVMMENGFGTSKTQG